LLEVLFPYNSYDKKRFFFKNQFKIEKNQLLQLCNKVNVHKRTILLQEKTKNLRKLDIFSYTFHLRFPALTAVIIPSRSLVFLDTLTLQTFFFFIFILFSFNKVCGIKKILSMNFNQELFKNKIVILTRTRISAKGQNYVFFFWHFSLSSLQLNQNSWQMTINIGLTVSIVQ
jgi:hypothetical protein